MPLSAPGARPAVATTAQELSAREAGACSSGRQERGCCQVGTTRLRSPGAGGGMDGTRALWAPGGRAPPQTSGGDSHPWRQVAAGGLLSAGKGGQGPALEPDSWAGEQGPRDAGAACRGGEPVPVGARTSGSLQRGGVRGVRGCRKQQRGGAWRLRETRVGRGPAGRVGGAPRARSGRSREEGGGRASAGTRLLLS